METLLGAEGANNVKAGKAAGCKIVLIGEGNCYI